MKQLTQIGPVAVRKLALGGINSIEALEAAESHRIEVLMGKNPPFGIKLLANLKDFPKLRVSVKMMGKVRGSNIYENAAHCLYIGMQTRATCQNQIEN